MPEKKTYAQKFNENWKAIIGVFTAIGMVIGGWNYAMAQAEDTAGKKAKAVVHEEVKQVAQEEVKKALDEQKKLFEAQKEEASDLAAEKMYKKLQKEGKIK